MCKGIDFRFETKFVYSPFAKSRLVFTARTTRNNKHSFLLSNVNKNGFVRLGINRRQIVNTKIALGWLISNQHWILFWKYAVFILFVNYLFALVVSTKTKKKKNIYSLHIFEYFSFQGVYIIGYTCVCVCVWACNVSWSQD